MKQIFTFLLIISCLNINAQTNIKFGAPEIIVEHPDEDGADMFNLLLPLDYNSDDRMDLVGIKTQKSFVLAGNEGEEYEYNNVTDWSSPIFDVMDIDNDGDEDVIMEDYFLLNDNGTLAKTSFSLIWKESIVAVADFDGDNVMDFVSIESKTFGKSTLRIYRNNGGFESFDIEEFESEEENYNTFRTADIDNDGDVDLIGTISFGTSHIRIWYNDGQGVLKDAVDLTYELQDPFKNILEIKDLDADGDLDLLMMLDFDNIMIVKNENNNFESEPIILPYTGHILALKLEDFNQNGLDDIVYVVQDENELVLRYIENKGDLLFGNIRTIKRFPGSSTIYTVLIGNYNSHVISTFDYNNDGKLDIIFNSIIENKVYKIINDSEGVYTTNVFIDNSLTLFPLPLKDKLFVKSDVNYEYYSITNMLGETLYSNELKNNEIQLGYIPSGSYILNLINKSNQSTSNIIIKD